MDMDCYARRSALGFKVALVTVHLIYAGILFLFDGDFVEKAKREPWYTCVYLLLFVATLIQYFVTSSSSPGYVLDAMRAVNESEAIYARTLSDTSEQPASGNYGSVVVSVDPNNKLGRLGMGNYSSWSKLVMDAYSHGNNIRVSICSYCEVEQPPRAKHCHDCDKCVLQFDHHCVWLGTCIGQDNRFKFWWKVAMVIILLIILSIPSIFLLSLLGLQSYLVLTNQTEYERIRRQRIPYLRGVNGKVNPFSKGICSNISTFCCARGSVYRLDSLPTPQELEENSRPYTCLDCVTCRCC